MASVAGARKKSSTRSLSRPLSSRLSLEGVLETRAVITEDTSADQRTSAGQSVGIITRRKVPQHASRRQPPADAGPSVRVSLSGLGDINLPINAGRSPSNNTGRDSVDSLGSTGRGRRRQRSGSSLGSPARPRSSDNVRQQPRQTRAKHKEVRPRASSVSEVEHVLTPRTPSKTKSRRLDGFSKVAGVMGRWTRRDYSALAPESPNDEPVNRSEPTYAMRHDALNGGSLPTHGTTVVVVADFA